MPIKPENRGLYPKDWPAIARAVKDAAGWACAECGVEHGQLGYRDSDGRFWPVGPCSKTFVEAANAAGFKLFKIVMTVHHVNGVASDCRRANLRCLCCRCHNIADAPMRRIHAAETRRQKRARLQPALEI